MNIDKKTSKKTNNTIELIVRELVAKKEMKRRVQKGENIKTIAKEYGFTSVLPL